MPLWMMEIDPHLKMFLIFNTSYGINCLLCLTLDDFPYPIQKSSCRGPVEPQISQIPFMATILNE